MFRRRQAQTSTQDERPASDSRQVRRAAARRAKKDAETRGKAAARIEARRARLRRQSAREKAGAYAGQIAVARLIEWGSNRTPLDERVIAKGAAYGRRITVGKRELHVTKGWRRGNA